MIKLDYISSKGPLKIKHLPDNQCNAFAAINTKGACIGLYVPAHRTMNQEHGFYYIELGAQPIQKDFAPVGSTSTMANMSYIKQHHGEELILDLDITAINTKVGVSDHGPTYSL